MGRKLDALTGRRFKTSKLKTAVKLAISRLAILKNHRHARFNIAHSDLIQLLRLNHHQRALIRVEQVIKDQNMLVVYDMIHDYCHLLKQRVNLIEQANDCPEELKEAVSSLLYAAPRCGEFPELREICAILTARFGKELVNGVSQKMLQKLSSKALSLESRTMMLTGIAREDGIVLQLEATVLPAAELARSESLNSDGPESPDSQLENLLISEPESKPQMSDSGLRYDSESDYDEIIEEDEGERSKYDLEVEELDDLYPDGHSDDDNNIKSFENMDFDSSQYKIERGKSGFPSRTVYFSSYKQFPFKQQTNLKAGS